MLESLYWKLAYLVFHALSLQLANANNALLYNQDGL